MAFKKVLIAIDDSPVAAHAAAAGIDLARSLGAEIAFIHIVSPVEGYAPEGGISPGELLLHAEQQARALLEVFRDRAGGQPPPLTFSTVGKAADEIVKAARDWPADIIVIGTHGRGGLKRLLWGSVAEGVMRSAPCPVFVVRAPQ